MNSSDFRPAKLNLEIYKGRTYDRTFLVQFKDTANPWLEAGDTAFMQLRPSTECDDTGIIATLSTENGKIILDVGAKTIRLLISDLETNFFEPDSAVYDLEIHHAGSHSTYPNQVSSLFAGKVKLIDNVTRIDRAALFGNLHINLMQFQLIRPITQGNDRLNIVDGKNYFAPAGQAPLAIPKVIAGAAFTTLGDNEAAWLASSLQFYDANGAPLTQGAANAVRFFSSSSVTFASTYPTGTIFYLAD